jgi:hypothetical protein
MLSLDSNPSKPVCKFYLAGTFCWSKWF